MTAMVQTGPDAWAGVLGTHRGELVRTARSRLGAGGADAEDVVHDVVVRVLRRRQGTWTRWQRRARTFGGPSGTSA
jgi:DNA-directed RNA polymerase specialized sigma24 family protein